MPWAKFSGNYAHLVPNSAQLQRMDCTDFLEPQGLRVRSSHDTGQFRRAKWPDYQWGGSDFQSCWDSPEESVSCCLGELSSERWCREGSNRICPVCNRRVLRWDPWRHPSLYFSLHQPKISMAWVCIERCSQSVNNMYVCCLHIMYNRGV